jgi:N-acetylmuramoyl-L-alanine amidase
MSYSGNTRIVSEGLATGPQIDAFFVKRGVALAPAFAPDKTYAPAPDNLGEMFIESCQRWEPLVNHDLAAAQCVKEAAAWQSYWARSANNPAGIGVTGVPGAGERFATPLDGIVCQVAHLLSYAVGTGPWVAYDRRYEAMPRAWVGTCPEIDDLGGKWATPGVGYGEHIAEIANALLETDAPMAAFEMPPTINAIPVRKSFIPAGNSNRPGTPATSEGRRWITVHETANPNVGADAEMHRRYTHGSNGYGGGGYPASGSRPANEGVSFTFVVDQDEIVWLLPLEEKSWQASDGANGTGNSSASIEACVNSDGEWARTRENLAQLVAYLVQNVPGRSVERIAQHNQWARDAKNCPSLMRASGGAQWNGLLARVRAIVEAPGERQTVRHFPETGHHVGHGFLDFWQQFDDDATSLSIFGYPLTEELTEASSGLTIQYFERAIFEHHPEHPPAYHVLLRRLGAEALAAGV